MATPAPSSAGGSAGGGAEEAGVLKTPFGSIKWPPLASKTSVVQWAILVSAVFNIVLFLSTSIASIKKKIISKIGNRWRMNAAYLLLFFVMV